MDASRITELRQKLLGWPLDAGLLGSLLLALIAVQLIDRLRSVDTIPTVDLVFILDQGPAMRGFIDGMKASCVERAEGLKSGGVDCRFAVLPFGRLRRRIPTVPLTGDVAAFKRQLQAPPGAGKAPMAASGVAALEEALAMEFRKDAQVLFFVISKSPCKEDGEVAGIGSRMVERGIAAVIQADASEKDHCKSLYQNSGRFFSMEGTDLTGPIVASSKTGKADKNSARAKTLLASLAPDAKSFDSSQVVKPKGLFSGRTSPNRQALATKMGGSLGSEMAVREGLAWLARHQADEGYWSQQDKCESSQPCQALNYQAAISETGLAILAFQAGGNYYFNDEKYSEQVTRGLDWLVKKQREDGCLFGQRSSWYEHGMGTFALAEACAVALANDEEPEPRYLDAAKCAVKFTERHQYTRGGWQYDLDSPGNGDTSVTGWQVLSLKSAQEAKIDVSRETILQVQRFYESCGDPETGLTGYMGRHSNVTDLTTAVGLIVQEFILNKPNSPLAQKAALHLKNRASDLGASGDFYTLYNGTLAMFLSRGDTWKQWNLGVRDAVVNRQEKSGCARGSWTDRYGRTLGTSWAVLTLEVYYRYAPGEAVGEETDHAVTK